MDEMRTRPTADPFGTLRFSAANTAAQLSRQHRAGRAVKLTTGIYVVDSTLPARDLARHHLWEIVAHVWPSAVICDRSALDGATGEWVFVCHPEPPRESDLRLPGVSISCRVGPGPLPGDMPWPSGLHMSGVARGLIENLATGGRPPKGRPHRAAGAAAVGDTIDHLASSGEAGRVATALAELDHVAGSFDPVAVDKARRLLAAALGTSQGVTIDSSRLKARAAGQPYDGARTGLFERMCAELEAMAPSVRPVLGAPADLRWLPFFEGYFSNYIEGTVFSVDEAYRIAIRHEVPQGRPADAHDISATYRIVNDPQLMAQVPRSADEFLELMTERHAVLMAGRPEKRPGQFKVERNYAGGTAFVTPEQLVGTLRSGWNAIDALVDPFHRAVMMMFVVSECHPFDDGNGRLARIMTNAELVARGQHRVVIPNCYRNNYLAALTGATNGAGVHALTAVLDYARKWVAAVDWSEWQGCLDDLGESNAFTDPAVAEHSGQTLRLPRRATLGFPDFPTPAVSPSGGIPK